MDELTPDMVRAGIEEVKLLVRDFTITPEEYVRRIYGAVANAKHKP